MRAFRMPHLLRFLMLSGFSLLMLMPSVGCEAMNQKRREFMHELQPHRLSRWNRWSGPTNEEVYFSVEDPIEELAPDK